MSERIRSAARALRNFLRGFVGIAPTRPLAGKSHAGDHRPFCC